MNSTVLSRAGALTPRQAWAGVLASVAAAFAALLVFYWPTVVETVHKWNTAETYTHGFLVFPISAYLIWRKRHELIQIAARPAFPVLALFGLLGFAWELGSLARVIVVQQYSLIAMMVLAVWAMLGTRFAYAILFPLLYLFFAVPFGEVLLPPLMNFTADFTVGALQLTGIPVYREGNFFSVPTGNWSVIDACSGLRYLIASLTLGTLYAYLTYRSFKRRAIFIALSMIVPIIANGFRAYMIVMIGHLSNMRLATGIDHVIYGWVFFGIVILLLFWAGSFWREDTDPVRAEKSAPAIPALPGIALSAFLVAVIGALWPLHAAYLERGQPQLEIKLVAPGDHAGWQAGEALRGFSPHFVGTRAKLERSYAKQDAPVGLFIGYYRDQRQGFELINSANRVVPIRDKGWNMVDETSAKVAYRAEQLPVQQTRIWSVDGRRMLVWHWYEVDGRATTNPYHAKYLEAFAKFRGRGDDATVIAVYTPYDESLETGKARLSQFVSDMFPAIQASLRQAAEHVALAD